MTDYIVLAQAVLSGAGAAAVSAAIGYVKAHFGPDAEAFDVEKAAEIVAVGAVLGGVAGYYGFTVLDAQNILVSLGLFSAVTYFVHAGVKALVRFVRAKLGRDESE